MAKAKNTDKKKSKTPTNNKEKGPVYDKILRENLMEVFMPLIKEKLDFEIKSIQQLPDKQETTLERETDAFLLVESTKGEKSILHLEFQTADDHSMVYRNAEHHGIEIRKYKLPIKHIVIYIGEKAPTMPTQLKPKMVYKGFDLVDVQSFKPEKFLSSQVPERIILAILCNYPKADAEKILTTIFNNLRKVCKDEKTLGKYIKQLIIFSQLRKLEELTITKSKDMPVLVDPTKSYLYQLGKKEEKKKRLIAEKEAQKAREEAREKTKKSLIAMKKVNLSLEEMLDFSNCETMEELKAFLAEIEAEEKA